MRNKITYGLIPVLYLVGIYLGSFLLVYFSHEKDAHFGPCGALHILYINVHIEPISFGIISLLAWISQFIAVATVTLLLLSVMNVIEINGKCVVVACLASIIFVFASTAAYEYIVVKANKIIYGMEVGVMGPVGFMEEFVAGGLLCLPLIMLIGWSFSVKYKNFRALVITSTVVFIALFVFNKLTTDLWYPPLINYGSIY
ncbi:MAG: hypothetical protein M0042_16200 [Nitrospiraceae bacterium]|nr:hypothetical protein [Nitrospiraceae bacterium]